MMPSNFGSASGMTVRSGWLVCTVWADDSHESAPRAAMKNKVMSFMACLLMVMEWRRPPPSRTAAKVDSVAVSDRPWRLRFSSGFLPG